MGNPGFTTTWGDRSTENGSNWYIANYDEKTRHDVEDKSTPLLAMIALSIVQSSAQTFIQNAILVIDTSGNA